MDHSLTKKQRCVITPPSFECYRKERKSSFRWSLEVITKGINETHYFQVDEYNYSDFQAAFDKYVSEYLHSDLKRFSNYINLSREFPRQHFMFMHSKIINNLGEKCRSLTELSLADSHLTDQSVKLLPKADLKSLKLL